MGPWPLSILASIISSKTHEQRIRPKLEQYLALAESNLSKNNYLAGSELTAADITSIYPMDAAFARYPIFHEKYPLCRKWINRMSKRDAFKKAQHKLGENQISPSLSSS